MRRPRSRRPQRTAEPPPESTRQRGDADGRRGRREEHDVHGACSRSAQAVGVIVNMNGTTKAGSVNLQVSIIVVKGLPPVMAAAANGESAVGGLTSERTA